MKQSELWFGVLRLLLDAVAVTLALLLSYYLRSQQIDLIPGVQLLEPATTLPKLRYYVATIGVWSVATFVGLSALLGLYRLRATRSAWSEIGMITTATGLWLVLLVGWFFFVEQQLFYSRVLLVHATTLIVLLVSLAHAGVIVLQRRCLRYGIGRRTVRTIGSIFPAAALTDQLERDNRYMYEGHLDALEDLQGIRSVDFVIQTDASNECEKTLGILEYCRSQHIEYSCLPPVLADVPHLLMVERMGLLPVLALRPTPLDGWGRIYKRAFDTLMSVLLLIVLSPVFLVVSLLILLLNGWPILYVSRRVGLHGQATISLLKFRTMVRDADVRKKDLLQHNQRRDGPLFKIDDDPRVTKLGALLRRFDIDELPQLLNVLCGHMSLVGPRPHLPEEVAKYSAYQRRVFAICPGITGLAQVSGRSTLEFNDEVQLDLRYIEEWSLWFDIWILWRTVWVVLVPEANKETSAS